MIVKKITPVLFAAEIEPCLKFWMDRLGFEKTVEVPDGEKLGFAISLPHAPDGENLGSGKPRPNYRGDTGYDRNRAGSNHVLRRTGVRYQRSCRARCSFRPDGSRRSDLVRKE